MKRLLKAEYFKMSRSMSFWLLLVFSVMDGVWYGAVPERYGAFFTGYDMYMLRMASGMFNALLIGVFAASFVCDEFSDRTFGLSFFCGFTRRQVFLAKAVVFFAGILPMVLLHVVSATAMVMAKNGFGGASDNALHFTLTAQLLCYLSQSYFIGSWGVLAAFLIRNRLGTFGAAMGGAYIFFGLSVYISVVPTEVYVAAILLGAVALLAVAVYLFERCDLI